MDIFVTVHDGSNLGNLELSPAGTICQYNCTYSIMGMRNREYMKAYNANRLKYSLAAALVPPEFYF